MKKVEQPNTTPVTFDRVRFQIQNAVSYFDDIQKTRIAMGNRICAAYHQEIKLKDAGRVKTEEEISKEEKEKLALIKRLSDEYKRITDYYVEKLKSKGRIDKAIGSIEGLTLIRNRFDYELMENYNRLLEDEEKAKEMMKNIVVQHPMWDKFFKDVKGCGPSLAGKIIAGLNVHEARHVSSFWSYCGVGTRPDADGNRVAMTRKTTVMRKYLDKDGNEKECKSLGYNPQMQSVVTAQLCSSILKTGKGSKYWECYYDYKNRYTNRADLKDASKMRIHRMATRQVAKALLRDLWVTWRQYEGYEISQPYEVEYLGNAPHKYNEYHARAGQSLAGTEA